MDTQAQSQFKMVTVYSDDYSPILVPDVALRGLVVDRRDFERVVEEDENANSDPESYIDSDRTCEHCSRWLEEFYCGRAWFLIVGARVSFEVPGTSVVAYLDSTVHAVQSGDDEYVDELFEEECNGLAARLEELGIVVLPVASQPHHPVEVQYPEQAASGCSSPGT